MSRYVSIATRIWHDEKFRDLPEDARTLFLYLLSSPHGNMCGFYFLPPGYACHDLQWKEDKYKKAIGVLTNNEMVVVDGDVVLIKNFIKYNPIKGPKQAAGAANRLKEVPANSLVGYFINCLKQNTNPEDYERFIDTYGIPYQYPTDTLPIPDTDTETDTEEETEEEKERAARAPHQEIADLYNSICKALPKVKDVTDKRKEKIRVLWRDKPDIDIFELLFVKAEESEFLSGRSGKWNGCSFDWLINYNNAIKVLEGNYDNKNGQAMNKNVANAMKLVEKYDVDEGGSLF